MSKLIRVFQVVVSIAVGLGTLICSAVVLYDFVDSISPERTWFGLADHLSWEITAAAVWALIFASFSLLQFAHAATEIQWKGSTGRNRFILTLSALSLLLSSFVVYHVYRSASWGLASNPTASSDETPRQQKLESTLRFWDSLQRINERLSTSAEHLVERDWWTSGQEIKDSLARLPVAHVDLRLLKDARELEILLEQFIELEDQVEQATSEWKKSSQGLSRKEFIFNSLGSISRFNEQCHEYYRRIQRTRDEIGSSRGIEFAHLNLVEIPKPSRN